MKRYVGFLSVLLCLLTLLFLPRAALALLAPPAESAARIEGGVVVGDGTPESCTEEAFAAAFTAGGTISFNCGTAPFTLTLQNTYDVTTTVTIDGNNLITLHKLGTGRHFRVFDIGTFTLNNLTLYGNLPEANGGVNVNSLGVFTGDNVTFTQNTDSDSGLGGAVANFGSLTLSNSRFVDNYANWSGGGLFNGNQARLTDVDFSYNAVRFFGGGVTNDGTMIYNGGTVMGNTAFMTDTGGLGGGVVNLATLAIEGVTFRLNQSLEGSALYTLNGVTDATGLHIQENGVSGQTSSAVHVHNDGTNRTANLKLYSSEVSNNESIGIWADTRSDLLVTDSTIAENALRAMFLYNVEDVYIYNSTVSHNNGSLYAYSAYVDVAYSTIVGNGEYNVEASDGSRVRLENNVLALATVTNCFRGSVGDSIESLGYNLATDAGCNLTQPTDFPGEPNTGLGPLSANGGGTRTHLPDATSLLLEHGNCNTQFPTDQRGVFRPQGAACDIGAVERATNEGATPTPTATVTATPSATPSATPTLPPNATATGTPVPLGHHLYLPLIER